MESTGRARSIKSRTCRGYGWDMPQWIPKIIKPGVTVILPCEDNPFVNKLTAAAYVHNGFGKTTGTLQIVELGTLETPIALTNTLNVGLVQDALVDYMITKCRAEKVQVSTVNAVVGECNDGFLNRIRERAVGKEEVYQAIQSASRDFEEGDVGAGKGTSCFGMKGGIGSASRILELDGKEFVIGALVQSNFGSTENFMLNGRMLGRELDARIREKQKDEGSIMMVIGTDLPVSRPAALSDPLRRAGVGPFPVRFLYGSWKRRHYAGLFHGEPFLL